MALEIQPGSRGPLTPLRSTDVRALRFGEIVDRSRPELLDDVDVRIARTAAPAIMQKLYRTLAENPWSDADREEFSRGSLN